MSQYSVQNSVKRLTPTPLPHPTVQTNCRESISEMGHEIDSRELIRESISEVGCEIDSRESISNFNFFNIRTSETISYIFI